MKLTPEQLIQHAEAVNRLMSDKSVQQVWDALEQAYYQQWQAAKTPEEREAIWASVKALGDLKQALETTVQRGQHEAAMAARRAQDEELMRRDPRRG